MSDMIPIYDCVTDIITDIDYNTSSTLYLTTINCYYDNNIKNLGPIDHHENLQGIFTSNEYEDAIKCWKNLSFTIYIDSELVIDSEFVNLNDTEICDIYVFNDNPNKNRSYDKLV